MDKAQDLSITLFTGLIYKCKALNQILLSSVFVCQVQDDFQVFTRFKYQNKNSSLKQKKQVTH